MCSMAASLLTVPVETALESSFVDSSADLNSLARTCHLLHGRLDRPLYTRPTDFALRWAVLNDDPIPFQSPLALGVMLSA